MSSAPLHQKKPTNHSDNHHNTMMMNEHPSMILSANYQYNEDDKSMTVADFLRKQVALKNDEMKLISERMVQQIISHGIKHREEIKQAFRNQQKQ